ncbi:hypothetical protein O6H91_Y455200 [Diphasiastrum complanatum]|nr:hypothetical protein O6H91_Y455200 [Diphasiastrum complanatum]
MELLKEQSLSLCLNWRFELSLRSMKVSTCSVHGRIALIDGDELMYLSLIEEEDALRLPSSPHLYDKVVAAATNAALTAPFHSVKRKSQIQDLLGGVIKELRSSVGSSDQFPANHAASELHTLFAREPFQMSNVQTNSAESNLDEPLAKLTAPSLEIDDIEIEDDDFTPTSPATSKMNIVKKLKESLPGTSVKKLKENLPGKRKSSHKDDSDDRNTLLEGGSNERKPSVRTVDEIKAAYGHRTSGEASSAAGLARDKLLERQEKLQAINKRTEEMQEGAENFASLAEELAKKMQSRKWWEI